MTLWSKPPRPQVFYPGPAVDVPTQWNTGYGTPSGTPGGVRDTNDFLANRPKFKARRTTAFTIATGHQFIPWNQIDIDNYGGGASGSSIYTVQVEGWYLVAIRVSIFGTGAAGQVLIPSISVNGASPTSIGSPGWEGPELPVPQGGTTQPKAANGSWLVYGNVTDTFQADLWFSSESGITAIDTTNTGFNPAISLVWWSK